MLNCKEDEVCGERKKKSIQDTGLKMPIYHCLFSLITCQKKMITFYLDLLKIFPSVGMCMKHA